MSSGITNRNGVVEWPPSAEILEAAGGVGFGGASTIKAPDPAIISREDVVVPPIIRSLHPKLAADGFARHRRDPLFLYKVLVIHRLHKSDQLTHTMYLTPEKLWISLCVGW